MNSAAVETPVELMPMCRKVEEAIKRRVAIGTKISYPKLHQELMQRFENARAIDYVSILVLFIQFQAIISMIKRDEFSHHEGRKILSRKK